MGPPTLLSPPRPVVREPLRVPTLPRKRPKTSNLSSWPPDLKFPTHLMSPLICPVPVLFPCLAWNSSNVNLMTTRSLSFLPHAPSVLPSRPVLLDFGTSTPLRLLELTVTDSPLLEISP